MASGRAFLGEAPHDDAATFLAVGDAVRASTVPRVLGLEMTEDHQAAVDRFLETGDGDVLAWKPGLRPTAKLAYRAMWAAFRGRALRGDFRVVALEASRECCPVTEGNAFLRRDLEMFERLRKTTDDFAIPFVAYVGGAHAARSLVHPPELMRVILGVREPMRPLGARVAAILPGTTHLWLQGPMTAVERLTMVPAEFQRAYRLSAALSGPTG